MNKSKIAFCGLFAGCFAVLSAHAETFTAISGKSDWSQKESFTVGGAPATRTPGADDTVYLNANATWSFTSGTDSFNVMANVKEIRFETWKYATLEITVPSGTADINCVIGPAAASRDSSLYKFCNVVKKGEGTLRFVCGGSYYLWNETSCIWNIYANIRVQAGAVRFFPDSPIKTCYIGVLEVAEGAKVYLPNKDGSDYTFQLRGTVGSGEIIDDAARTVTFDSMPMNTNEVYSFSGEFKETSTGLLLVRWSGPQFVAGGKSANRGTTKIWSNGGAFTTAEVGRYGVTVTDQLGMRGRESSLGASDEISLQWVGGVLWYGGSGETTDKQFTFQTPSENNKIPAQFSAGSTGNVIFDGSDYTKTRWYANGGTRDTRVILSGDNAKPMHVRCPVISGAAPQSLYFLKRGTGAWSFENDATDNAGSFAIEEGALQFTSLDESGMKCSLGKATRLHTFLDGSQTLAALDATLGSPFAVTLCATSAVTRGALEYTGAKATGASDRSTGLSGHGGKIVNNGQGTLLLNGVTVCDADLATTLVLGGTNAGENVVFNVTNGVGGIAVVKEDSGKWTLADNVDVDSVEVKGGTLVLERTTGKSYSWFKFIMKEARNWNLNGSGSATTNAWPCIEEFVLQDAEGNRVFTNPVSDDVATGGTSSSENWRKVSKPINCHGIGPNSIAYGCRGEINAGGWNSTKSALDDRLATNLFDNAKSLSAAGFWPSEWNGVYTGPMRDRPDSWISVVMRLPADAPHVAACDLVAANGGGWQNELFAWGLEGSRDGIHWETVTNYMPAAGTGKDVQHRNGNEYWSLVDQYGLSAGKSRWTPGETKAPYPNGYPFPGVVTTEFDFPSSLAFVKVSGGGTLKIDSTEPVSIGDITVDATTGGSIVNGTYASAGTLSLENVGDAERIVVPGTFAGLDIGGWTVNLPQAAKNRDVVVRNDGSIVISKRGLMLIFR